MYKKCCSYDRLIKRYNKVMYDIFIKRYDKIMYRENAI